MLLSIGGTEIMHFQTWQDKAGSAPNITDGDLTFPDLNSGVDPNTGASGPDIADLFQTNLIMPEPTAFLTSDFPPVSIIRPTATEKAAMGAVKALTADGLFIGQTPDFFNFVTELATMADAAQRGSV